MLIFNRFRPGGALHYSPGQSRRRRPGLTNTTRMFALKGQRNTGLALPLQGDGWKTRPVSQGGGEYALPWAGMQWPFRPKIQKATTFTRYFAPPFAPIAERSPTVCTLKGTSKNPSQRRRNRRHLLIFRTATTGRSSFSGLSEVP